MKINSLVAGCCLFFLTAASVAHSAPTLWVGDSTGKLGTVDAATGNVTVIGNMGIAMTDIAFDPSGNLYGITFNDLYKINKSTAAVSFIGSLGTTANSLVFDNSGVLYTANSSLYTVNTSTGVATLIGNGGTSYSSSGDLAFVGGNLFLSNLVGSDTLIKLNTSTGSGTLVGSIGFSNVFGLASPNGNDLYGLSGTQVLSIDPTTGAGTLVVDFSGKGLGPAWGSAFFSESGAPVPEPTTAWLLSVGLLGLLGIKKIKTCRMESQ